MENKLCRFLLVNEDDIKNSDLFTDSFEFKKAWLANLYSEVKKEHAGILFFLNYAEDLLKKESEKIPGRIERATRELDRIRSRHIDSIDKIGKMQHVSAEFLGMTVNMYAMYELDGCSPVEFSILEGLFNSIEKTRPSMNDDLKGLLEQYKAVYEYEKAIEYDRDLEEKINIAIMQIRSLHKNYIKTLGFEEKYIKKQHKETIKEIGKQVKEMFNLLCASGNNISALAIINEMCKSEFKNKTNVFVRTDLLSNFRLHGDGIYLQKFQQYVNDGTLDKAVDLKAVSELGSQLLLKYKRTIVRMKKDGLSLGMELDLTSELIKVDKIIKEYYEMKSIEEIANEILKKYGISKKNDEYELKKEMLIKEYCETQRVVKLDKRTLKKYEFSHNLIEYDFDKEMQIKEYYEMDRIEEIENEITNAEYDFEKEMQTKDVDLSENGEADNIKTSMLVLRDLNDTETKSYFQELSKLQINKVKNIADEVVLIQKSADFFSEEYLETQEIQYIESLELFEKLDDNVSNVFVSYVSKRLEMIDSINEKEQNIHYLQKQKEFERSYNKIAEKYDLYEGREPQKTAQIAVAKKFVSAKVRKLEPLEEELGKYKALFSAEPNGVDLDERIDKKNRFYICNFNPNIGIMTFPYANIKNGMQTSKYGRAAIIYDMNIHDKIVCENRGASWASDPDERLKKEINGKEAKVYTGNRLTINNKTHNLQEVISKAIFTGKEDKEDYKNGRIPYLSGHKFDYRKGKLALHFQSVVNAHERNAYHSVNDVAWISDDSIDISKYKAVCYMDSAEELKNFIEELG